MFTYNTIDEALEALRQGQIILVTDDDDRENEGDFICAAEFATTENINFMATHGKGLICMPMSAEYVQKLQIPQMVSQNTDNHETAFTVSIDHVNTTTGISAAERSVTAMKCVEDGAKHILDTYGVKLVFVTCGADGCFFKNAVAEGRVPSLKNISVIDTTGAGDIFGGSAVSQLLKYEKAPNELTEAELRQITNFSCTAAGLSTTKQGGANSVPELEEILARL